MLWRPTVKDENKSMQEAQITVTDTAMYMKKDIGHEWRTRQKQDKEYKEMDMWTVDKQAKCEGPLPTKPRKWHFQTRIALRSIVKIIRRLSMEQREAVTSSGLGGLLNLRCTKLDHDLCEWLVQKFDPKTCSLNVHGRRLLLTELDVHKLLGIPAEGKTIELKNSSQAFPKLFKELGVVQGPIKLNALREYLTKTEGAGEEFMRIFALYMLGAFLCPTTKDVVKQSFIHLIQNVDGMKDYNWSKFTLQFFVRGLCKYNSKSHSQPNGCLFLIMLFYFDRVAPSGCDAGRARSIPSLAYWGDAEIKATLKLFQKSGGYQNEEVDVNFVVDEPMQPFVQSEEMKNMNDIRISKIETTVCDMKSVLEELVVIVKSGITNSSIPKVMEKCEPLQMSKQQEAGHGHCKCEPGIVAPGVVVESTVVPIVEHVSPILVPKPNVVVESTVVPTVEHENNTLPPKPNVVVALENMEENRIPLTPSNLQLDAHLHEQTKQAKNKIKVRLNNNRRKKIPKLKLIDESSSSIGPYGGPCTQHSDARVDIHSPFTAIAGKKRKATQKVPTKTKLHLDESDSSLDTKEDKFDQSLNLLGKLLGLNFEASATAIESSTTQIVRPCPLSAEEQIVKAYCFDKDLESSEDIVVMELFYTPVEFATRFDLCSLQPKTWICGSIINLVVAQLTNAQRRLFPDKCHRTWYFPTYVSQHIINGADHAKLCDEYFGESRYTGKLHACQEIYIPVNDHEEHWFCVNIDMAHRMAYIFDSSPSLTNDKRRELMARKLVQTMHLLLQQYFGDLYVANVKEFELERLKDACLQHKTDSYDCGMFVMKYMQGVVMPTGVHKFDKLERFRLLVDLVNDSSNRIYIEVMNRLEQYKERYSRLRKVTRKKKV
ncbi:unnamed protein product [Camellia sinensis]